jgi:hypothetical protein
LAKDVELTLEVTSRPITGAQVKAALFQARNLKIKMTPYSGLGMTAYYFTFTEAGTTSQGIAAISHTKIYSAGVFTKTPEMAKLAALVRLAERL